MFRSIAVTLALCLATGTAHSALLGRAALTPGGTDYQAYYDDVYNLTWVADANLAYTSAYGGLGGVIQSNLGRMNWYAAQGFAASLNTANYLGTNTWRMPTAHLDIYGFPDGVGEMNDLYFGTLGNTSSLTNTGPFVNVRPFDYWSGTKNGSEGVVFDFGLGTTGTNDLAGGKAFAWAVSSGDTLTVIPAPAAAWLFGSALGLMGWLRRGRPPQPSGSSGRISESRADTKNPAF